MTATFSLRRVTTIALAVSFLTVNPSSADPVTIHFTLFPDARDPVNIGPSDGFFTYDSGLIPAAGGWVIDDNGQLAGQIAFSWGATSWTEANAGVFALRFDNVGRLRRFRMGGAPNGFTGMFHTPIDDFSMSDILMEYTLAGHPLDGFYQASITSPELNPVPEPGTMLLVGGGVLYLARRRAQRLRA